MIPETEYCVHNYMAPANISDLALIIGNWQNDSLKQTSEGNIIKTTGPYWIKSDYNVFQKRVQIIDCNDTFQICNTNSKMPGIRLVLPYNNEELVRKRVKQEGNKTIVIYGEFPRSVETKRISQELEYNYEINGIAKTISKYHSFAINTQEYIYKKDRYIRLVSKNTNTRLKLSDRRTLKPNRVYWIKVEPIRWILDRKNKLLISEEILFSGEEYGYENRIDFKETHIYKFINRYLKEEMFRYEKEKMMKKEYEDNIKQQEEIMPQKEFISIDNKMNTIKKRIRRLQER